MSTENTLTRPALIKACNLARLRLDAQALGPMISRSQFDRVADHLLELLSVAELVPAQDLEDLRTELADEVGRRDLAIAINGLLHGKRSMEERFKHALGVFAHWGLARWPLLTVWSFLLHPDRYLLVDREGLIAQDPAAGDLPEQPDWTSYCLSQRIGLKLKKAHGAEDLIDVVLASANPD
ncbi:MAG: hypothetical protein AAGJ52_00930 [Pseudomonadota bacterium]